MKYHTHLVMVAAWWLGCLSAAHAEEQAPKPELKDGDVVAFIGGGFIEREGRYGYIETALTARYADRDIKFRNLGWSGDTVWCESRAYFGTPEDGFRHLLEHVDLVKPTVIILNYGGNEAFAGPEGLPNFIAGYERLLDELEKRTKRIMLFSPEATRLDLDSNEQHANRKLYTHAIADIATRRGYDFLNLLEREAVNSLTDQIELRLPRGKVDGDLFAWAWDTDSTYLSEGAYRFLGALIADAFDGPIDLFRAGRTVVLADRAKPLDARKGPDAVRAELRDTFDRLRTTIVAKNDLFFHRHRPQNETYLRGFRKHEQGNNAGEILEFEKLVAEKEKEIAKLRQELLAALKKEGVK